MTRRFLFQAILMPLAAILTLISCSKDDIGADNNAQLAMATFVSEDKSGSTFSYQAYDDSPEITLTAPGKTELGMKKGTRTMLYYTVTRNNSENAKTIALQGTMNTFFDSLRIASNENIMQMRGNAVRLKSIWRSGNFINFNIFLQYTGHPRQFLLVVDNATRDKETADLYLIDNTMGVDGTFFRQAYASFFIGNLWNYPRCKRVRVHLIDESFPTIKYYDFSKNKQQ